MHLRGSPAAQHYGTWEASPALPGPGHVNVGEMAHTAFLSWQFRGTAREGATGMSVTASQRNEAGESYAVASVAVGRAGVAALGSLTIPGRPEHVREARAFVAKALGELHPALENAVLLTSELVTNAVMHSASRCSGGTITIEIGESAGGVRIEVTDAGSDLSAPVVRGDAYASDGHGLFLVQTLSEQWGYLRSDTGTTVWCWLTASAGAAPGAGQRPHGCAASPSGAW
jgi:anti-sigma regulatory factor (Ser/Thr protein kinase)